MAIKEITTSKTMSPESRKGFNQPSRQRSLCEDDIRSRAYENYCRRNGAAGDAMSDWLEAENSLRELAEKEHGRAQR